MEDLRRSVKPIVGKDGVSTPMRKVLIELAMEGELDDHIKLTSIQSPNRRNGYGVRKLLSSVGGFDVLAPRDRNSNFEPRIVEKRQHKISSDID